MLSNEVRKYVVRAFDVLHDTQKVAEIFSVSQRTVNRILRQMEETGTVETKVQNCGRKSALSEEDIIRIKKLLHEQPNLTVHEINEKLNFGVCDDTVRRQIVKMGLR